MLTIKKEEQNDKLQSFLNSLGCHNNLDGKIIMSAKDGGNYLGAGTLELKKDKVYLNFLVTRDDDLSLKLGILKSLLNLADLRGIKTIYGNEYNLNSLYKMARFKEENGEYILDLEGYFTCGC